MAREKIPATPAIRTLKEHGIDFTPCPYKYEERGGTKVASQQLGIDEHTAIKTLVMEDEKQQPFIVLMHGDKEVSTKSMARFLGTKTVAPCDPKSAYKHTGYMVGGTSPFGLKKNLAVYIEESILASPRIYINGGRKGLLVEMATTDLVTILNPTPVNVGY